MSDLAFVADLIIVIFTVVLIRRVIKDLRNQKER